MKVQFRMLVQIGWGTYKDFLFKRGEQGSFEIPFMPTREMVFEIGDAEIYVHDVTYSVDDDLATVYTEPDQGSWKQDLEHPGVLVANLKSYAEEGWVEDGSA